MLTSHCDILKYATADIMFIKDREFLVCRLYRKVGSTIYVVAKSFEIDEIPKHSVSLILALHICYIVIQCLLKKMCRSSEKVTADRKS
ncbi:unnamed protein product [Brugia pahangi]|uniref:Transcriptional regulator n=1 Tax=Brugia pahangi TaxID=6280 RepID=A0A0N4TYR2_BRUPA|nr:unnamed protein product [Brugia pahangi]